MNESIVIYDCEIIKAIPPKNDVDRIPGIEYCEGWNDHVNMGISVIGAYDYLDDQYHVFCEDNFMSFKNLIRNRSLIVGFNSLSFDNKLCAANNILVPDNRSYDLLVELWAADGLGPKFEYPSHAGYGLDQTCTVNFQCSKNGNGALAPVLWQQGKIGEVIDYCINDVRLTKLLMDAVINDVELINPSDIAKTLKLRNPIR